MTPEIQNITERLEVLYTLRDAMNEIIVSLQDRKKNLISKEIEPSLENITPESYMPFRQFNNSVWKKLRGWFYERYGEFGEKSGVRCSGSFPNGQAALEVVFDQGKPLEDQLGLLELWPFVEPFTDDRFPGEEPKIVVGIFEETLSQHASYSIVATPDKKRIAVTAGLYTEEAWTEDGDLKKILKYVYKKHPYRRAT